MKHYILSLVLLFFMPSFIQAKSFGSGTKSTTTSSSKSSSSSSTSRPAAAPAKASSSKPVSFGSGYKQATPPATPPPAVAPVPVNPVSKFGTGYVQRPARSDLPPSTPDPVLAPGSKAKFGTGVVAGAAAAGTAAAIATPTEAATVPPQAKELPPPPVAPNQKALDAQKKEESKAKFEAYKASKDPIASTATPTPDSDYVKYNMGAKNYWKERENRERVVYRDYYNAPQPTVVYRDNYNPYFFMWLAAQSMEVRAATLYNHRNEMDRARYEQQLAENAELRARVAQLESQGKPDGNYIPPGMEGDLMYNKKIAEGVRAQQKVEEPDEPWSPVAKGLVTFLVVGGLIGTGWYIYQRRKA